MKTIILAISLCLMSCAGKQPEYATSDVVYDKESVPMVVIQPRYPTGAAADGVGGYVKFIFDILVDGSPSSIRILESKPEGVFDYHADKAIRKWKFKPAVKNGQAIVQTNMVYTMQFVISND